jgi:nitrite reductase/ring-hydroxylating ferredoxin subunit
MAACPHRGGPIGRGRLACRVLSEGPGAPCVDEEQVLLCPWHGWEFSLRDGRALADPKVQLRAFPAEVRDGRVMARL